MLQALDRLRRDASPGIADRAAYGPRAGSASLRAQRSDRSATPTGVEKNLTRRAWQKRGVIASTCILLLLLVTTGLLVKSHYDRQYQLDLQDPLTILNWAFLEGPTPPHPFHTCGNDNDGGLGCVQSNCQ